MNIEKALEALEKIVKYAGTYSSHINNQYTILRQALTPPSEQEVCKALSEYLGKQVKYGGNSFAYLVNEEQIWSVDLYQLREAPHLITLIGRFYEALNDRT